MQGLHGMWAAGGVIVPFVIQPFLVDINCNWKTNSSWNTSESQRQSHVSKWNEYPDESSTISYYSSMNNMQSSELVNFSGMASKTQHDCKLDMQEIQRINYAFIVLACICFLVILFVAIVHIYSKQEHPNNQYTELKTKDKSVNSDKEASELHHHAHTPKQLHTGILILLTVIYTYLYKHLVNIPINFLATFTIKGLLWTEAEAGDITGLFFLMIMVGCWLGVAMAHVLSPCSILLSGHSVAIASFILLQFFPLWGDSIVVISMATAGLGLSVIAPSTILWLSEYTTITPFVSSMNMVGNSVGATLATVLAGYLIYIYGHMSMIYLLLAVSCVHFVWFGIMLLFAKWTKLKPHSTEDIELLKHSAHDIYCDQSTLLLRQSFDSSTDDDHH